MTRIIGGIVAYEDGIKTVAGDQFSPTRKVRVELNFSIDDGEDADDMIGRVLDKSQAFVVGKLKGVKLTPAAATASSPSAAAPSPPVPPAPAGKTKADLEAEKVAAASGATAPRRGPGRPPAAGKTNVEKAAERVAAAKAADAAKDPASMEDVTTVHPTNVGDPAGMDDFTVQPAEVTDADLNAAVQRKNGALKDPVKIRGVIALFNPDPAKQFTLAQIPQAQRKTFLDKLEALA